MDEILVVVPRNITAAGELQTQVQRRVLDVLAKQIIGETSSSSPVLIDIRRCGLETLHQILQFSGHTLVVGWETIFEMLSSVCAAVPNDGPPLSELTDGRVSSLRLRPPPLWPPSAKANLSLIRVAFQSLTLVCDSVDVLTPEHLRLCISTLGLFGRQSETNIALTAAESLLWGVSDSIQSKRKDIEKEPEYSALWMFLLLELLGLCSDLRPEVRNGAMQTLFRSLQLYGATLSPDTWTKCLDLVVFPLLESMSPSASQIRPPSPTSHASSSVQSPAQSWDETKCLAFQLVASVFGDFLVSQIMRLPTFGKIWEKFVHHIRQATLRDHRSVSTAALKCLDVSLGASKNTSDDVIPVATIAWESAWHGVDEIGEAVGTRSSQPSAGFPHTIQPSPFTQESLEAFAAVIRTTYSLSGSTWDLDRIRRLLAILKGVLTYSRSPEYRPDVDTLTPVQVRT
jgi:protein MON2